MTVDTDFVVIGALHAKAGVIHTLVFVFGAGTTVFTTLATDTMVYFTLASDTNLTAFAVDFVAGVTRTGSIHTTLTIGAANTGTSNDTFAILRTTELSLTTGLTTIFAAKVVFAQSRQTLL